MSFNRNLSLQGRDGRSVRHCSRAAAARSRTAPDRRLSRRTEWTGSWKEDRSMAKSGGPGEKMTRAPRTNNVPRDDDEQTQVEIEMASPGGSGVARGEGRGGAPRGRGPPGAPAGDTDEGQEPTGPGSDVAPTRRAEERERERHRLERALG